MTKKHALIFLCFLLMSFWLVLSFRLDLEVVIIGFFACLLVLLYNFDLVFNDMEATKITLKTSFQLLRLLVILIWEIFKSNIHVAKIVLSKHMPIDPGFESVRNPLKKDLNQTLFANAITLTPGTLTIDISDDYIVVHGLVKSEIKNIEGSQIEQAFIKLEEVRK
ncbi:MAG: hypothetical protein CVV61_01770 [Tenericutes bacterium HGW-Tenericutes-6]|nr:MAG: hypothetical protein CVV61_01770 [Tenericutes bacterium HGW-Tenericutes-6]